MSIDPTKRSAALAGAWCTFGMVPFELWTDRHPFDSLLTKNAVTLIAFAAFLVIPVVFFVIGRIAGPFSRTWFLDPVEGAQVEIITRRMFCWFLGAAIFGSIWSLVLSCALR
ncbi:hypothetical protein [Duganella sp. Root1480D1]|uniref:hypothetical protein n=1 Tax=Duganella sp. Root1480D1 TaxID=1736471 RepID=UPI0012E3FA47|nr:hypothetical protein [Duganella sp. Root1480D1]